MVLLMQSETPVVVAESDVERTVIQEVSGLVVVVRRTS